MDRPLLRRSYTAVDPRLRSGSPTRHPPRRARTPCAQKYQATSVVKAVFPSTRTSAPSDRASLRSGGQRHCTGLSSTGSGWNNAGTQTDYDEVRRLPDLLPNEKATMTLREADDYYDGDADDYPPNTATGVRVPYNRFYQNMVARGSRDGSRSPLKVLDVDGASNKYCVGSGPPTFRSGRAGSSWRHVRQCTGNLGNHICFIDGVVKQQDMRRYPPYGYVQPAELYAYISPRYAQTARDRPSVKRHADVHEPSPRHNRFNNHAQQGFKYWYEDYDQNPVRVVPKQTIQGKMLKMGVGT